MILRALQMSDAAELYNANHPGSFCILDRKEAGQYDFVYLCPCGCGQCIILLVGEGFVPTAKIPSFNWNGSHTEPSLFPIVEHLNHTSLKLEIGYWESVL